MNQGIEKKACVKIVTDKTKVVDCISKTKYGSFVNTTEKNTTI